MSEAYLPSQTLGTHFSFKYEFHNIFTWIRSVFYNTFFVRPLGSKQQLGDIKTQISQVTNDIPLSALTNVSDTLGQLQREINKITPEAEWVEHIR